MSYRAALSCETRPRCSSARRSLAGVAVAFGLLVALACSPGESRQPDPVAATPLHQELKLDEASGVPVPPEDGPRIAPIKMDVSVRARPSKRATAIGYLRVGSTVARSEQPVSTEDCPGGWYAIRPVGFVCADDGADAQLKHPIVQAIHRGPDRSRPLPYHYAFLRAVAPNYLRVPTWHDQFKREMRLERHLRNWKKFQQEWDAMGAGANDVPLGPLGYATGGAPASFSPPSLAARYGGEAGAGVPPWLEKNKRLIPNLSSFRAPQYAVMAGRIKRHAGVALIDSFVAKDGKHERRFALTTDARLIPADKLKADGGSTFHGESIRDVGLPVAFARKAGASWWTYEGDKLTRAERLEWREFIPLSGKLQRIGGVAMVQARNGKWLRKTDVKAAPKPRKLPWFATGKRRWIQVSLLSQTLVLWEGSRPVYATLVSTGRDGIGDPKTSLSTPQGVFRIYAKHVTTTMDSDVAEKEFELRDVPWVMYFKGGYALHGAYWHDEFGRPRSHGCVNLSPIDARIAFLWSSPDVPEGWHGTDAGEVFGRGTLVQIEP